CLSLCNHSRRINPSPRSFGCFFFCRFPEVTFVSKKRKHKRLDGRRAAFLSKKRQMHVDLQRTLKPSSHRKNAIIRAAMRVWVILHWREETPYVEFTKDDTSSAKNYMD